MLTARLPVKRDREGEFCLIALQDRFKNDSCLYVSIPGTPVPGPILARPRGIRPAAASHHVAARLRAAGRLGYRSF